MVKQYLDTMKQGLKSKILLLDELYKLSETQKEVVSSTEVDWDEFDRLVDKKGDKISELEKLDQGFDSVYQRIRSDASFDKSKYKDDIMKIQVLIREVTEKSTGLMALEQRNKVVIENSFGNAKKRISQNKKNSAAAANYYKNMSRINYIDPQLMDSKK